LHKALWGKIKTKKTKGDGGAKQKKTCPARSKRRVVKLKKNTGGAYGENVPEKGGMRLQRKKGEEEKLNT